MPEMLLRESSGVSMHVGRWIVYRASAGSTLPFSILIGSGYGAAPARVESYYGLAGLTGGLR
jgi:hypothetical protein